MVALPWQVTLVQLLSGYSGVTSDVSVVVPALLLPGFDAYPTSYVSRCTRRDNDRSVDGDDCYQLVCGDEQLNHAFVIRKRDLTLRMFEEREDLSGAEKYHGSMDFSQAEVRDAYVINPLPMPDDLGEKRTITFRGELNGPVDPSEVELPDEEGDGSVPTNHETQR